jgi:hypothetical protein
VIFKAQKERNTMNIHSGNYGGFSPFHSPSEDKPKAAEKGDNET